VGLNAQTHDGIGGLFYFQVNDVTVSQDYLVFTPTTFTGSYTFPVNLTMGDTVKVYAYIIDEKVYDIDPLDFNRNLTMNVTSLDTDIVLRAVSKPILYGDTMKLNTILPKIKCSEIFEVINQNYSTVTLNLIATAFCKLLHLLIFTEAQPMQKHGVIR
jgi:hypothetical protein